MLVPRWEAAGPAWAPNETTVGSASRDEGVGVPVGDDTGYLVEQ